MQVRFYLRQAFDLWRLRAIRLGADVAVGNYFHCFIAADEDLRNTFPKFHVIVLSSRRRPRGFTAGLSFRLE
jgi:hypothetical protein